MQLKISDYFYKITLLYFRLMNETNIHVLHCTGHIHKQTDI